MFVFSFFLSFFFKMLFYFPRKDSFFLIKINSFTYPAHGGGVGLIHMSMYDDRIFPFTY